MVHVLCDALTLYNKGYGQTDPDIQVESDGRTGEEREGGEGGRRERE